MSHAFGKRTVLKDAQAVVPSPSERTRAEMAPDTPVEAPPAQVTSPEWPKSKRPVEAKPAPADVAAGYLDLKKEIFGALIESINISELGRLDLPAARREVGGVVSEILAAKRAVLSSSEQFDLTEEICNDVLGYGPLEPLLARDDISDIMVNGTDRIYIEVGGKVVQTNIRFRDNEQLLNICQRIVSQVGRRLDESSPICDARLPMEAGST